MKNIIKIVPIPAAGVALGLASLGVLLQPYSEVLHITAGILSLIMITLLGIKMILYPGLVREDLKSPIPAGVLGTLFMTLMLLSTYLAPLSFSVAFVIWCVAILAHLGLIVYFTATFMLKLDIKQVYLSHLIAYVGINVAALTSPAFGMEALGMAIFWFGFACYMVLFVLVTYRYIRYEVPEPAKPLFCIYAAPMSLSLAGYLSVASEPSIGFVVIMTILAQVFLLAVLTQLPKLLRLRFYPSYAAMTFPFVISASALVKASAYFATLGVNEVMLAALHGLAIVETLLAAVMVLYVFARYVHFFLGHVKSEQAQAALSQAKQ